MEYLRGQYQLLYRISYFFNVLGDGTEWALGKSKMIKKWEECFTPDGCAAFQMDLDRLERWASRNSMKFNDREYQALHLGRSNPRYQYRLNGCETGLQKRTLGPWWTTS